MANVDFFDQISDGSNYYLRPDKPIWALGLDKGDNDKEIHNWLMAEMDYLTNINRERMQRIMRNRALYKGLVYNDQTRREERAANQDRSDVQRILANHIFDLIQQRKSKLIKYRPGVQILPTNDEFADKVGAKMTKYWLDHIWYTEQFDGLMQPEFVGLSMLDGEAYMFIEWDPEKGDLHHDFDKDMLSKIQAGEDVPLLNEFGKPELDAEGKPIMISTPIYNGDVGYKVVPTTDVLVDRKPRFDDSLYIYRKELQDIELARLKWPKATENIKASTISNVYDWETLTLRKTQRNEVEIFHFYLKRQKGCDQGRYIIFTRDGILSNRPFPYSHNRLPCVRFTDIDLPGEMHGKASMENIKGLTGAYNNLTNMILKNQVLCAHPKWMMPAGAAKLESLGNDITIVQYKGPQAPVLVQSSPTPSEVFAFRENLKQDFQQIYGIYGVSRGEPPPGIKSGVALQFIGEQESERLNEIVLKWNETNKQVAIMTIAVAGDFYQEDEKRLIRVMGKTNAWTSMFFDSQHLSKDYDIRVQNSSALPQSKAARIQTILDIDQQKPGLITNEQFMDILEFGQDEKYTDIATVSVRSAQAENEALLSTDKTNKIPVSEPVEYEDHIQHWKEHARIVRSWPFKYQTEQAQQVAMADHVRTHEMFMVEQSRVNPLVQQALATLPGFPMFFKPDELAVQAPIPAAAAMQQQQQAVEPLPQDAYAEEQQLPVQIPGEPVNISPPNIGAQLGSPGAVEPTSSI